MHKNTNTAYAFLQGYMGKEAALPPRSPLPMTMPAPEGPVGGFDGIQNYTEGLEHNQRQRAQLAIENRQHRARQKQFRARRAEAAYNALPDVQRQPMSDQSFQQELDRIDAHNQAVASQLHGTNQRWGQISVASTDRWLDATERKQREQLQTGLQNNDPRYVNYILNKGDAARQDRLSQDASRRSAARSVYNNRHSEGTFYDPQTNRAVSNSQPLPFRTNPVVAAAKAAQDAEYSGGAAEAAEARRQAARAALAPLPQATPYQNRALNFGKALQSADTAGAEAYSAARQAVVKDVEGQIQNNARGYVDNTYKPFKTSGGQDTGAYIAPGGTLVGAGALNRRVGQHLRPQLAEARRWSAANTPTPAQVEIMKQQDVTAAQQRDVTAAQQPQAAAAEAKKKADEAAAAKVTTSSTPVTTPAVPTATRADKASDTILGAMAETANTVKDSWVGKYLYNRATLQPERTAIRNSLYELTDRADQARAEQGYWGGGKVRAQTQAQDQQMHSMDTNYLRQKHAQLMHSDVTPDQLRFGMDQIKRYPIRVPEARREASFWGPLASMDRGNAVGRAQHAEQQRQRILQELQARLAQHGGTSQ